MTSNEHPDMSGNPCDEPILCEHCGKACNENNLHGSDHDESKTFCRQQCVDDWEEVWGSVPSDDDGSTSIDQKLRDLLTLSRLLAGSAGRSNAKAEAEAGTPEQPF